MSGELSGGLFKLGFEMRLSEFLLIQKFLFFAKPLKFELLFFRKGYGFSLGMLLPD